MSDTHENNNDKADSFNNEELDYIQNNIMEMQTDKNDTAVKEKSSNREVSFSQSNKNNTLPSRDYNEEKYSTKMEDNLKYNYQIYQNNTTNSNKKYDNENNFTQKINKNSFHNTNNNVNYNENKYKNFDNKEETAIFQEEKETIRNNQSYYRNSEKSQKIKNTEDDSENINNYISQIMEKDKIIFEYSKLLKESERTLDKNKSLLLEKDDIIFKLNEERKELKYKNRNLENSIIKKEEETEKYKNHIEEKILNLKKEKILYEEKYLDLTKLFENNHSDFQNTVFEYKKIENNLEKMKINLKEKDNKIKENEKFIDDLKREIKLVPLLKKENFDIEQAMKKLKKELEEEKKISERIILNTNETEKKLNLLLDESQRGKEIMNNNMKLNYEIENLKKENEFKNSEIENFMEKYKSIVKENDNFVKFFTNEISDFNYLMENIDLNRSGLINGDFYSLEENLKLTKNFDKEKLSLKFEILNKNFFSLKKKYVENYNQNFLIINKFEKSLEEIERINRGVMSERDDLIKEISILNQVIEELNEKVLEEFNENEKINQNYLNLNSIYQENKTNFEDLHMKNDVLIQETNMFLINCKEKLKENFPEIEENFNCEDHNSNSKINYYFKLSKFILIRNKFR